MTLIKNKIVRPGVGAKPHLKQMRKARYAGAGAVAASEGGSFANRRFMARSTREYGSGPLATQTKATSRRRLLAGSMPMGGVGRRCLKASRTRRRACTRSTAWRRRRFGTVMTKRMSASLRRPGFSRHTMRSGYTSCELTPRAAASAANSASTARAPQSFSFLYSLFTAN